MRGESQLQLNARQRQLLDRIAQAGEVRIAELRTAFAVTEMTIRRDLEKLEALGSIRRTFGGAIFVGQDVSLKDRTGLLIDEKIRIGHAAAAFVRRGESLFLDGGTTTMQVARALSPGMNVTVVTNALNVAAELSGKQIPTMVTGGALLESTLSLIGPLAVQSLSGMAFDRCFLGATGIDAAHGFSNSNFHEAEIKRLAIRQSASTAVVLDHSKHGSKGLASFAPLTAVDVLVTDAEPGAELLRACTQAGVKVIAGDL